MAQYFQNFPSINYRFGNETYSTLFQNLAAYVDVVDVVKDNLSFFVKYSILDGDRPDVLSMKLYGEDTYYFTFFLMNDKLREQGWPMTAKSLLQKVKVDHPNYVLTTRDVLSGKFKVGQTVTGNNSGATGIIIKRRLDFGQIVIQLTSSMRFSNTEIIETDSGAGIDTLTLTGEVQEHLSVHHYEDTDGYVDIDPAAAPPALYNPITYFDYYTAQNENLRSIHVIKPESINSVYSAFRQAMES